jgi:hypothetical protein
MPRRQRNRRFFDHLPKHIRRLPDYASHHADFLLADGSVAIDEAIAILKRLHTEEPADLFHVLRLAQAFQRKNDVAAFTALAQGLKVPALVGTPRARANLALLLRDGGRPDDALVQGLAAVRAAPADHAVALTYVGLLINQKNRLVLPAPTIVAEHTAVRLRGPRDESQVILIERGESFRGIDVNPPDHPFVRQLLGKIVGDTIVLPKRLPPGETWTIAEIKNGYLFLLHHIMEDFERRFAGYDGLARIDLDMKDLSSILDYVRAEAEANQRMAGMYTKDLLPLEFVSRMMGGDVLSFANYIVELGHDLFTCVGTASERDNAIAFAGERAGRGAVLDSYTACTAAMFGILPGRVETP